MSLNLCFRVIYTECKNVSKHSSGGNKRSLLEPGKVHLTKKPKLVSVGANTDAVEMLLEAMEVE
jgi:hypothetical protein